MTDVVHNTRWNVAISSDITTNWWDKTVSSYQNMLVFVCSHRYGKAVAQIYYRLVHDNLQIAFISDLAMKHNRFLSAPYRDKTQSVNAATCCEAFTLGMANGNESNFYCSKPYVHTRYNCKITRRRMWESTFYEIRIPVERETWAGYVIKWTNCGGYVKLNILCVLFLIFFSITRPASLYLQFLLASSEFPWKKRAICSSNLILIERLVCPIYRMFHEW